MGFGLNQDTIKFVPSQLVFTLPELAVFLTSLKSGFSFFVINTNGFVRLQVLHYLYSDAIPSLWYSEMSPDWIVKVDAKQKFLSPYYKKISSVLQQDTYTMTCYKFWTWMG